MIVFTRIRLLPLVLALALLLTAPLSACDRTSPETDREALVALYNATDGESWKRNNNWLSSAPIGEWHGVSVDEDGRVVMVSLLLNQLSGEIPRELGDLASLKELWLSRNQLSGKIPRELANLTSLNELHLDKNQLSGEIPPELDNLANLWSLSIDENRLSGCVSDYLSGLDDRVNLPVCAPPGHPGDKETLTALFNSTEGESWKHSDNWLSSAPLGEWFGVSVDAEGRVLELNLPSNQLSGEVPPGLGNLARLRVLRLYNNQLNGEIPPKLGKLANLRQLYLRGNRLSGEIPPELSKLANLWALSLDDNRFERGDTAGVGQSRRPHRVGPRRQPVERRGPAGVGQSRQLGMAKHRAEPIDRRDTNRVG